jgi:hypothetical protein
MDMGAAFDTGQVNVGGRERWISALAGTGLILRGLAKPSMGNALLGLLGVGFMYRAATGHCPVYGALGYDTSGHAEAGYTYGRGQRGRRSLRDAIEDASEDSFPASDPPSWTPTSLGGPTRH